MCCLDGGGRGGGRGGGGGRSNKSEATKKADQARLAALMAKRKEVERAGGWSGSWDPIRGCAREDRPAAPAPAEADVVVECLGESTRAEAEAARNAAGQQEAIDLTTDPTADLSSAHVRVDGLYKVA